MKSGVKVFAPASVSNVACGFDMLGFALEKPGDEVIARFKDSKGLIIDKITGVPGKNLTKDIHQNTAGIAVQAMLRALELEDCGIALSIHKKMPLNTGIGSSGTSAVAALMAVNEILKRPFERRELLPFAMHSESVMDGVYHGDNVAPSLLGGIIFIRDNKSHDLHRLPLPPGLYATVVYPHIRIVTKDARQVLADGVDFKKSNEQTANMAGLIIGLFRSDFDLIQRSLKDVLVEPQRAHLIPGFYMVKEAALEAGALGCSISGAGPSIFCLSANSLIAEKTGEEMQRIFKEKGIESDLYISRINQQGARVL